MSTDSSGLSELLRKIREPYTEVDERCRALAGEMRVEPRVRHSLGTRLSHWLMTLFMFTLIATGFALWSGVYGPLEVDIWAGYYVAFGLHMWAGILILTVAVVLFPFYHTFVDGHHQVADVADLSIAYDVGLAFVGLKKYLANYHEARRAWDERRGEWITGHPAQKTFFWWVTIFTVILGLTGFAMYREMATDPVGWVVALGFMADWTTGEVLTQIHLVLAAVVAAMVMFHIYFSVLPSNWDILKSMVTGRMNTYIVDTEDERVSGGGDD